MVIEHTIRERRERLHLSQARLAILASCTEKSVWLVEHNRVTNSKVRGRIELALDELERTVTAALNEHDLERLVALEVVKPGVGAPDDDRAP